MTFLLCISMGLFQLAWAVVPPSLATGPRTQTFSAVALAQPGGDLRDSLALRPAGYEGNQRGTGIRGDETSPRFAPRRFRGVGRGHRRGSFSRRLPNMPMPLAHGRNHKPYVRRRIE
jgi:hypothetical protein